MTTAKKIKNTVEESPSVLMNTMAQKKSALGIKVYNLSAGEPKLPMDSILIQAAIEAMDKGKTLYPPVSGIPELKYAASEWMNNSYACSYDSDNCLVVNGGKLGIYLLLQLTLSVGDEVIIVSPYWVSYPAITKLFGGTPVFVETDEVDHWKLTPEKLIKACTSKSKVLILNNGSNPTGAIYTRTELNELLNIAKENDLLVISDEVYSGLTYNDHAYISCGSFAEHKDNVIVIQSCSKNFSMTGWRIGFVFGKTDIIKQLTSLISQSTSGATTIGQWIALAAIKNENAIISSVREKMLQRRNVIVESLNQHFGININPPASSLYIFISLADLGVSHINSTEFCTKVLEEINVALVPGIAFGKEGYIRFSFGSEEFDLSQGVKILAEYLRANQNKLGNIMDAPLELISQQ